MLGAKFSQVRRGWLVALTSMAMACSAAADLSAEDKSEDAIIAGVATFERPEVGLLHVGNGYCTATLVAPNVAITAAHCVEFGTANTPANRGTLTLYRSATDQHNYTIERYV